MRVLGIGAHPGDLEILCGGALTKYATQGSHVVMCHVAQGEKGGFRIPSPELASTRQKEAERAAKTIGAEVVSLGLLDGEVSADDPETRLKFVGLIRQIRPDVIITQAPQDTYHSDYAAVSKLVLDASFHASVPYVETEHDHLDEVPAIYYMETMAGLDFLPSVYVDITDTFNAKLAMLSQHRSRLAWLKEHSDLYLLDLMEAMAKFRGWQCGVRYAEGFVPCLNWARVVSRRLLP